VLHCERSTKFQGCDVKFRVTIEAEEDGVFVAPCHPELTKGTRALIREAA